MLEIPHWVVIVLVQITIILFLLFVYFYIRARKYKKQLRQQQAAEGVAVSSQITQILPDVDLKKQGALRERLALTQQRVKNLERFRDLFFELKDRIAVLLAQQQRVVEQMQGEGLPLLEQKALLTEFEKLKKEKETLEQHLQQVDAELNLLMDTSDVVQDVSSGETASADTIIKAQQVEIGRLVQEIADLEVEAATAQRIQSSITSINNQSDELTIAVEVLQDENQFLSDQIQALLKQEQEKDCQTVLQIDLMTKQLSELQRDYDELYSKHTQLESEYLKSKP